VLATIEAALAGDGLIARAEAERVKEYAESKAVAKQKSEEIKSGVEGGMSGLA